MAEPPASGRLGARGDDQGADPRIDAQQFRQQVLDGGGRRLRQGDDDQVAALASEQVAAVTTVAPQVHLVAVAFQHLVEDLAEAIAVGDDEDRLATTIGSQVGHRGQCGGFRHRLPAAGR